MFGIDDALLPAVMTGASAGLNFISGVFNRSSQAKQNAANIAMQREVNDRNYLIHQQDNAFNRQERIATQAYDSPVEKMARGYAAGISPEAALGLPSSPTAVSGSPVPMQSSPQSAPQLNWNPSLSDYFTNTESMNRAKSLKEQAIAQGINNQYLDVKNFQEIIETMERINNLHKDGKIKDSEFNRLQQELTEMLDTRQDRYDQIKKQNRVYDEQADELNDRVKSRQKELQIQQFLAQLKKQETYSQMGLNSAQAALARRMTYKAGVEAYILGQNFSLQERLVNLQEKLGGADLNLKELDLDTKKKMVAIQLQLLDVDLEKEEAFINKYFLRPVFGVDLKDLGGAAAMGALMYATRGKSGPSGGPSGKTMNVGKQTLYDHQGNPIHVDREVPVIYNY